MEEHPRAETEQKRAYERRRLRTFVETRLKRYGQPSPDPLGMMKIIDVGIKFQDGLPGHLTRITGMGMDSVKINKYHTQDVTGPMTQYTSMRGGEFTRSDLDPQASGMLPMADINELENSDEKVSALFLGSLAAATTQIANAAEGVDEHPITAQEAREVFEQVKAAHIVRF